MILKDSNRKFSVNERIRSFRYAFSGLIKLFREEHNVLIHLGILIIVIISGVYFRISKSDWIAIAIVSGMVFASECFNTAIEYLSDFVSPGFNEKIKIVKDVAAAGVLISVISSIAVGLYIFSPELIKLFK